VEKIFETQKSGGAGDLGSRKTIKRRKIIADIYEDREGLILAREKDIKGSGVRHLGDQAEVDIKRSEATPARRIRQKTG